MISHLSFTLARAVIASLLFWAVWHPSYNSNLFFKLPVFAVVGWGLYRALDEEEGALLLFYVLAALIFNPLFQIHVGKEIWQVIDIVVGILILLSIFLLDSAPFHILLKKPIGEKIRILTFIIFAVAWMFFGSISIYYSVRVIITVAKLKINGMEAQAQITRVTHGYHYTEDANDTPLILDIYITEYTFQTEDGRSYVGYAELYDNPVSNLSAYEFRIRYKDGYKMEHDNTIALNIEYEKDNPSNSRAVDNREGIFEKIFGGMALALFSLWPVISGFKTCKENFGELLSKTRSKSAV